MSARLTVVPATIVSPGSTTPSLSASLNNTPFVGTVVMTTPDSASPVSASLKPKFAAVSIKSVSSLTVNVLSAPVGASLLAATLIVVVAVLELSSPSLTTIVNERAVVSGLSLVLLKVICCKAV